MVSKILYTTAPKDVDKSSITGKKLEGANNDIKYIDKEIVKSTQKQSEKLVVTVNELQAAFKSYLGGETFNCRSKYDLDIMGLVLAFYSNFAFRDDLGKVTFTDKLDEGYNYNNFWSFRRIIRSFWRFINISFRYIFI